MDSLIQNNTKCSVIIRCHNEEQHIGKLLTGIMQQTVKDVEIIIVDSGSTDATLSIASKYPVKILNVKPEDFSFGYSLNLGCSNVKNEFIVIVSAHVYPITKDWLQKLLEPFDNPRVALVYGRQRGNETTKYSEHQIFIRWYPEKSNLHQTHPFCNNANAAIRRQLWEKLPYNEELTGLEDIDWAKRAIQLGYYLAYVSDAEVVHVHDETPLRLYNRYRREAIALKHIMPEEKFNLLDFLRLFFANLLSDYYHAWNDRVFWKNIREIFLFRFMQFWGTYRGFAYQGAVVSKLKQTFYYPVTRERLNRISQKTSQDRIIDYAIYEKER